MKCFMAIESALAIRLILKMVLLIATPLILSSHWIQMAIISGIFHIYQPVFVPVHKNTNSHSNLALYSQIIFFPNFWNFRNVLLWTSSIHVITKICPFLSISNRFWSKCKFWKFRNVKKSPKFQSFCSISNRFWWAQFLNF